METHTPPEYLYHYTSIKGLAHILSSQKIRLSPLISMDDKLEGVSKYLQHCKKYVFVSSWTDIDRESIPFWSMYAGQMCGVRIKMRSDMLMEHLIVVDSTKIKGVDGTTIANSIINQEFTFGNNYYVLPFPKHRSLIKVEYKDYNALKAIQNVTSTDDGGVSINLNWGHYKSDDWSFQSEWRFIAFVMPCDYSKDDALENSAILLGQGIDINLTHLFADIKQDAFEQMEILLGPKMDEADSLIVKSLLKEYNPKASENIGKSILQIR